MNPEEVGMIDLASIGSSQLGYITVIESGKGIPFEVKRVYWTYFTPQNVIRGGHAHKALQQVIFAVSGKIQFSIETKNGEKSNVELNEPHQGLYIPPMTWRDIKFSHNAILLCLASEHFLEEDYIRHYDDFNKLCGR